MAGALACFLTYPLITVSTRLQVQQKQNEHYKGNLDAIKKIIKEGGKKELFSGLTSALVGMFSTQAIYYYFC